MNIYSLINSRDIEKYCKKIKHQFNTIEVAVLINRCKKVDIDKKITLYQEVLDHYSDMEISTSYVEETHKLQNKQTIKELVQEEIERIEKIKQCLSNNKSKSIYIFEPYSPIILDDMEDIESFNNYLNVELKYENTYNKITEVAKNQIKKGIYKINYYNIVKKSLYSTNDVDVIAEYFVNNGNPILSNIRYNKYSKYILDEIYKLRLCDLSINIPTPFEQGDILVNWDKTIPNESVDYDTVFVLESLSGKNWNAKGYKSSTIHDEGFCNQSIIDYDSFEYYKGKMTGNYKILKAISNYLKNKISLDDLINSYDRFKNSNNLRPLVVKDEEELERMGFSKADMEEVNNYENEIILTEE